MQPTQGTEEGGGTRVGAEGVDSGSVWQEEDLRMD